MLKIFNQNDLYEWMEAYEGVPVKDAHSALGDCLMTLGVIRAMAEQPLPGSVAPDAS